ncbi:hypothetical protein [Aquimarina sp. RZ0]|uniref:hypothetical protein n=1 Tax=Aquimarina sp. RZ0 TaxID=2607730 RepID=UPI0011F0F32D|nr:hypothetical protein [Aquimarina sp. RZ0]KAA1244442.1 hypothetical protein F0000_16480 [Aquimarina sp. RZ0]
MKTIITGLLLLTSLATFSQTQKEKQQERQKNKVEIFSSKEKDNLQVFVAEEVGKMKLSEDLQDDYYMIIGYHTNKMSRLDDKDAQLTEKEVISRFKQMIKDLETDVKEILTKDQFTIHQESFSKIVTSVYNRNGWAK